ncbi:hypothetical protein [Streptomyces sp. NPDC058861]
MFPSFPSSRADRLVRTARTGFPYGLLVRAGAVRIRAGYRGLRQ